MADRSREDHELADSAPGAPAGRAGAPRITGPSVPAGRKLAEVVADRIRDDIAADGWRVGEVFGSETDLLHRYEVSRAVLREAVRLLEHHSVAWMRRGPGGGLAVQTPDPTASITPSRSTSTTRA